MWTRCRLRPVTGSWWMKSFPPCASLPARRERKEPTMTRERDLWDRSAAVDGPLAGVRVLALGSHLAAPLAATLLADQGADVISVDRPGEIADEPLYALLHRGRRR